MPEKHHDKMNRRRETEKIILLCMRHFVLYRYYGIIILKSQLLRRKGIVTIRSNIKGRESQLPTTLSSPVTKDNFMIIEFSENDKKNFNKASTIQDAYAEWERSLDLWVCQEKCVSFFVSFFTSVNLFCYLQIYHHHF